MEFRTITTAIVTAKSKFGATDGRASSGSKGERNILKLETPWQDTAQGGRERWPKAEGEN
jgi:hypothetical protein